MSSSSQFTRTRTITSGWCLVSLLLVDWLVVGSAFSPRFTNIIRQPSASQWRSSSRAVVGPLSSSSTDTSPSLLSTVIYADDDDFNFDPGQGGVRLAEECALCLTGTLNTNNNRPQPESFVRYTQLTPLDDNDNTIPSQVTIVGTGQGAELYQDPKEGTTQRIELAPLQAIQTLCANVMESGPLRDAMSGSSSLYVNLAGGNDVQVLEVLAALMEFQQALDTALKNSNTTTKKGGPTVTFTSLTHPSIPPLEVTATLVAVLDDDEEEDGFPSTPPSGIEKAVAAGTIFSNSKGQYFTVLEEDINPDLF